MFVPNYNLKRYCLLLNKGWALDGLGNYKDAIIFLDRALAIDPNNKYALNNKV